MPRIEIIAEKPDNVSLAAWRDSASPTVDVCQKCAHLFSDEGALLPEELQKKYPDAVLGSLDVEHPPYDDLAYRCVICNRQLSEDD